MDPIRVHEGTMPVWHYKNLLDRFNVDQGPLMVLRVIFRRFGLYRVLVTCRSVSWLGTDTTKVVKHRERSTMEAIGTYSAPKGYEATFERARCPGRACVVRSKV